MTYTAQQLCDHFPELVLSSTNPGATFSRICAADDYDSTSLIFVSNAKQLAILGSKLPAVVVTGREFAAKLAQAASSIITVENVRLAQALIKQKYADYTNHDTEWPDIHPSAVVHTTAKLGCNIHIGANTVIGKNVRIGDNTTIRANCVIEHDAVIGNSCVVHNLVNIGYACRIGQRVIIRPGSIIGNEGFGFAQDEQKHYHRIPHTGIVEIHDDVQIGSNCNIDRGTYGSTILARGVKVDALCHIAHNVTIDEDSIFVAQSGVAGSSNIGKRVIASGQTGILDHRMVVDDAILVHRCGVTEDINAPGMWAGTPPKPFKEYVSNLNSQQKLKRLEARIDKKLERLEKKLKTS